MKAGVPECTKIRKHLSVCGSLITIDVNIVCMSARDDECMRHACARHELLFDMHQCTRIINM